MTSFISAPISSSGAKSMSSASLAKSKLRYLFWKSFKNFPVTFSNPTSFSINDAGSLKIVVLSRWFAIIRIPPCEILCNKNNIKMINRVVERYYNHCYYYIFLKEVTTLLITIIIYHHSSF